MYKVGHINEYNDTIIWEDRIYTFSTILERYGEEVIKQLNEKNYVQLGDIVIAKVVFHEKWPINS